MRLVATDLDGTIVRFDGVVTPRTVAAIRACEDAGVPVVMVTGRPPRWLPEVIASTGIGGLAVCANGAVIYDIAEQRVHQTWTIDSEAVLAVAEILRRELPGAAMALETTSGVMLEPEYQSTFTALHDYPRGPLKELLNIDPTAPVIKILVRAPGGGDQLLEVARRVVGDQVEATHSNAADNLLELGPGGVSKAVTLARLVADLGISQADVVAFGDQPNDVPMLEWAGVGVAMCGGHPAALAVADEIAPPCNDDGVAQVLERLLA